MSAKINTTEVLALILSELNIDFSEISNNINIRKKIQKSIYILQSESILNLGYNYHLYIAGPYSRGLSDDYYAIAEDSNSYKLKIGRYCFTKDVEDKLVDFNKKFGNDYGLLECVATCHLLYTETFSYIRDKKERQDKVENFLIEIKPHFAGKEILIKKSFEIMNEW